MKIGSLFSGYGGLDQAVQHVIGGDIAWHVDNDPAAAAILAHNHPDVPNLGDITRVGLSYTDEEWAALTQRAAADPGFEPPPPDWSNVEPVDVLTGGFPCQDVSTAGRRAGLAPGTRSGLWSHMRRAIHILRPRLVVIENVRGLLSATAHRDVEPEANDLGDGHAQPVLRALGAVLGDLAELGFDARWHGLRAADVGAPHGRYRVFIVAWPAADTGRIQEREQPIPEPGGSSTAVTGLNHAPATDATSDQRNQGRPEPARQQRGSDAALGGAAVPDAHGSARDEWGLAAPGQAQGRRPRTDARGRGGAPAADADGAGPQGTKPASGQELPARGATPNPHRNRREIVERGQSRLGTRRDPHRCSEISWGGYAAAIARWEHILGRPAPEPTEPGRGDNPVLSPLFVEWLMGLPAGHVTDVPGLSRAAQLGRLGGGVVPQQAVAALEAMALRELLDEKPVAA
ncbi:DNA cytosine methyltransferase [Saccharopolyspora sp. 6T]|uniref:DNA cytosine methyltransferase n=1 Tax=Saccharopolyspora sp. 6T TaxID=2877238 RepID=UPI001CD1EA4D|nr:DNA cytosine methyltransferase [Saccharopolyspora sp. 6T]MCA1185784.1 DNA cytosine methyltransferase [Saccharopolyspora sp. 6T]